MTLVNLGSRDLEDPREHKALKAQLVSPEIKGCQGSKVGMVLLVLLVSEAFKDLLGLKASKACVGLKVLLALVVSKVHRVHTAVQGLMAVEGDLGHLERKATKGPVGFQAAPVRRASGVCQVSRVMWVNLALLVNQVLLVRQGQGGNLVLLGSLERKDFQGDRDREVAMGT